TPPRPPHRPQPPSPKPHLYPPVTPPTAAYSSPVPSYNVTDWGSTPAAHPHRTIPRGLLLMAAAPSPKQPLAPIPGGQPLMKKLFVFVAVAALFLAFGATRA